MSLSESGSRVLSVRVPADVHRKVEKMASAAGITVSDATLFFLQKGCKQPFSRRGVSNPNRRTGTDRRTGKDRRKAVKA